jgi:gliding motility-associated-like protein
MLKRHFTAALLCVLFMFVHTQAQTNLIVNGDFSLGNVGFTSGQNYSLSYSPCNYYVDDMWFGYAPLTDHTPTSDNMFMSIDGCYSSPTVIYEATVSIATFSNYNFSFWASRADAVQPDFEIHFIGNVTGDIIKGTRAGIPYTGVWTWDEYAVPVWNAGANTSLTIRIVNLETNGFGNDFALDDVKLTGCMTRINIPLLADTMFICNRKDTLTLSTGPYNSSHTYLWNTGAITPFIKVNQPGIYTVTLGIVNNICAYIDTVVVLPAPTYNLYLGPDRILCLDSSITMNAPSNGASYLWSTGSTNNLINISTPGTYWLEMTSNNCKNRDTISVNNTLLGILDLGSDISVCEDTVITLQTNAPGANRILWSTLASGPFITVKQSGTYWVKAQDSYCTVSDTIKVVFKSYPAVNLGKDTALCKPDSLLLAIQSPGANYKWNTGIINQPVYVNQPGTYTVSVEKDGCTAFDTIKVQFGIAPLINIGNDTILCQGDGLNLDATTIGSTYRWSTGSVMPVITAYSSGKYTVEVFRGGCKARDSINIYHQPKPTLNLGPDTALCFNQSLSLQAQPADNYLWQDGSTWNSYTANTAGVFWVQTVKGACIVRDSIIIAGKQLPILALGNDSVLCKETMFELDARNAGCSFLWNNQSESQSILVRAPGLFSVSVTNSEGCVVIDSIMLDTFPSPDIWLGQDSFVCEGGFLILDAGSMYPYYTWQDGSNSNKYEAVHAGIYVVGVKDQNQCTAWDSITLGSKPKPEIKLSSQIKICEPDFELHVPGNFIFSSWQDGSQGTTYRVNDYGKYTINVTDENYCTASATVEVKNNCPGIIYVPNAFTPLNNDGINDIFYPVVRNIKSLNFQVYNRWGQLLFETMEVNQGWNGVYLGEHAISDVYVYKIKYTGMDDTTRMVSGDFTLLK